MRTPLNAIAIQSIKLRFIRGKVQDIVSEGEKLTVKEIIEKLMELGLEIEECRETLSSCSDFLIFVVNDMLDLSQIKQGKLR